MKQVLLISLVLACSWSSAHASDFRFCDMEGTVQSATRHPGSKARTFDLSVLVSSAHPEKGERGKMGYTDCTEFVGGLVEIRLKIPKRFGQLQPGDLISFNYSAFDGFDVNGGFTKTFVNASLHSYQSARSRDGR